MYIHVHSVYSVKCAYAFIDLLCPIANTSGTRHITVSIVQSRKVNITINGSGEVYSCTLNNQTVNITSGQTVQQTGLAPNTNYTVTCYSTMSDSCRESRATFTTGTAHLLCM